jgi:hypothetical protein
MLQPYLNINVILKNSNSLTQCIDDFNIGTPNFTYLVSWDVCNLYPSIDLPTLFQEVLYDKPPIVISMAKFIFDNSLVHYNGKTYKQTNGIAMGTNCAVVIANLYMQTLIDKHFCQENKVLLYKRFIDDIFHLWTGTLPEFNSFYESINQKIPGLKFTYKVSTSDTEFLDLCMFRQDNLLQFRLFQKELNKYAYLTPLSCHPISTINGFIKGELIRIMRSCSTHYYYMQFKMKFFVRLLQRGFTFKQLRPIFNLPYQRHDQMLPKISSTKILPFIFPYTRREGINDIRFLVKKHCIPLLQYLPEHKPLVVNTKKASISSVFFKSGLTTAQMEYLNQNAT